MQLASINKVPSGAVISRDIYTFDGRMLISKGSLFRDSFFERLLDVGIKEIYIADTVQELAEDHRTRDFLELIQMQDAIHIDDVIYEKTRKQAEYQVMRMMVRLSTMRHARVDKLIQAVESIMEELLSQIDVVLSLSKLRSIDDYTYEHSVNVCVVSLVIGMEQGLQKDALKTLGIGAVLHDIGKVGISDRIIKKPGKLSAKEFGEIKLHTELGYRILKSAGIAEEIAQIALYHHERVDGSGYPHNIESSTIPLYARIVAIADFYDAVSNDRIYRKKMSPDSVYRELIKTSSNHLDEGLVEKFLKHIYMYPLGVGVILNTYEKGVVIKQNNLMPESPVVRVFHRNSEDIGKRYEDLDLSIHPGISIRETF